MHGHRMKKYLGYCLLLCSSLMASPNVIAAPGAEEQFTAQPFHAIDINGPINVQITSGQAKPTLQLLGDPTNLAHIYAAVKNDTLYLSIQPDFTPAEGSELLAKVNSCSVTLLHYNGTGNVTASNLSGPINVSVNGSGTILLLGKKLDLRNLDVAGSSNVHILGVESNLLNVQDNGTGKVNIGGTEVLQSVAYNGSGPLSMYWVNSTNVKVVGSGRGRIFLAGTAGLLDATIDEHTYLDAKYLRARRAFVNTSDVARADVWTQCTLSTLATGSSNIYYYNNPALVVGSYMQPPGAVIRMTGIDADHIPAPSKPC